VESAVLTGLAPTQFSPFQTMWGRVGSHGLPSLSADALLYMIRRFAGLEKPQSWNMPSPIGSALLRRAARFPALVYTPEWSQLPHRVVPSSCSCPNPSSCSPFFLMILVGSLGSLMSSRALPLISFSTSARSGAYGLV